MDCSNSCDPVKVKNYNLDKPKGPNPFAETTVNNDEQLFNYDCKCNCDCSSMNDQMFNMGNAFGFMSIMNNAMQMRPFMQMAGMMYGMACGYNGLALLSFVNNWTMMYDIMSGFNAMQMMSGAVGSNGMMQAGGVGGAYDMEGTVPSGNCRPHAQGLNKEFLNEVKAMAGRLNCDYRDLLGVMNAESGLNAQAVNKNGGATGLIQFMPATARGLGTTTEQLRNMSPIQQLKYVEKFLQNAISRAGKTGQRISAGDLYTMVFMPAKINKEIICQAGSKEYKYNKGLDTNKDGVITKTELGNRVISKRVDESIFC